MAHISIRALASFFKDEPKYLSRGENHYASGYVESFTCFHGVARGCVRYFANTILTMCSLKTFYCDMISLEYTNFL